MVHPTPVPAAALLPAAGRSRRMGRPKLLLPWGETTVVGAVVRTLRAAQVRQIVLVVAPQDRALGDWAAGQGVTTRINPQPVRGMLSSVQEGLDALGGEPALAASGTTLLVCPADLPALLTDSVTKLLTEMAEHRSPLAVPVCRGRRGHPLAIGPVLIAEIPHLDPAVGLRQLLHRHREKVLEVPIEDTGILLDIDTPAEYRSLSEGVTRGEGRPGTAVE
jgi:molybdenum cofactor cytidylyltransferase